MPVKILLSYKNPQDAWSRAGVFVEPHINKTFKLKVSLKMPDQARLAELMTKTKSPAEWKMQVVGEKIVFELAVGSNRFLLAQESVADVTDGAKRYELIAALKSEGLIGDKEATALRKRFPDLNALKALNTLIKSLEAARTTLQQRIEQMKKEVDKVQAEIDKQKRAVTELGGT